MAEWLVEEGIGEDRAILLEGDAILEARIQWHGELHVGHVEDARLISRNAGSSRGVAKFASGEEALVDKLPRDAVEGSTIRLQIARSAIRETRRAKLAQARPTKAALCLNPSFVDTMPYARRVRRFPPCGWDDLIGEALEGIVRFAGGSLHFFPTPAMLLVDVDGELPPNNLAYRAASVVGRALQRFDCGGSIGIDFPTVEGKHVRNSIDLELLRQYLHPPQHVAMNGFGFVQLIAFLDRPSILHLATFRRIEFVTRHLLRRAEHLEGPGRIELTAHPAVLAKLTEEWLAELRRRTGKEVSMRVDPALAIEAPHAQLVPR